MISSPKKEQTYGCDRIQFFIEWSLNMCLIIPLRYPPDNSENMDVKMEHSYVFWNANLELQRQVRNKKERVFLERFGTAEKMLKTRTVKVAF